MIQFFSLAMKPQTVDNNGYHPGLFDLEYIFGEIASRQVFVPTILHLKVVGKGTLTLEGVKVGDANLTFNRLDTPEESRSYGLSAVFLRNHQKVVIRVKSPGEPKTITGQLDGLLMSLEDVGTFDDADAFTAERFLNSVVCANSTEKPSRVKWFKNTLNNHPIRTELSQAIIDLIKVCAFPVRVMLELTSKRLEEMNGASSTSKGPTQNFLVQFEKTKITKGMTANICYHSLVSFRPMCLEIPRAIREYFQIIDIRVGKNSQLLSAVPIPATVFSKEDGTPVLLKMDVAKPGYDIVLSVTNVDSIDREFEATMFGQVEERYP